MRLFPTWDTATGIGGDEFCVIARISDMAAEAQLSEFLRELAAQREQCERLPQVSVGYACYHPERDSIEDVIARADRMMYHYKRKLKDTVRSPAMQANKKRVQGKT